MAAVVLAIDQGTTSVRASVLSGELTPLAQSAELTPRSYPHPGWVELDAEAIVDATERVAAEALRRAGCGATDAVTLGLANQGETAVVWERDTGRPIAPAIGWQCRRTTRACDELREAGYADRIEALTGLTVDPYFTATKLAWILDHVPGARARAARGELCAGTLDSFTLARWSRGRLHITDPSTACRTQLAELATGRFSDELCALFRVPRGLLADVVSSDATLGPVELAGRPVAVGALLCDQPAALLGTGCLSPGDVKCTYGTGAFVQVNTASSAAAGREGLLRSIAWELGGERTYLLEGSVLAAGDVLAWLCDDLGILASPDELDEVLRATPDSAGVLFAPALTGLGAPRWSPSARGAILGLHRGVRRAHLLRAALEGIAHQVADVLEAAEATLSTRLTPMWADGGLAGSRAFLALQADLLGVPLRTARTPDATTRGIAAIAAVSAGLAGSIAELVCRAPAAIVEPRLSEGVRRGTRERHRRLLDLLVSQGALDLL
jgi:glycerol kinase